MVNSSEILDRIEASGERGSAKRKLNSELVPELLDTLGIPYVNEDPRNHPFAWSGSVLRIGDSEPAEIVHDAAHYMVASKNRRFFPDFGLGSSPSAKYCMDEEFVNRARVVTNSQAMHEEQYASMLGILIQLQYELGDPYDTFDEHNWTFCTSDIDDVLQWLFDHGLIDVNGNVNIACVI